MAAHLDPTWLFGVWAAFGVAVVAWAAQSCFVWLDLASKADPLARLIRVSGAGCCLGIGVWSAHAVGMSMSAEGGRVDFRLDTEVALWLLAGGASVAALAWHERHRENSTWRWVQVGGALGLAAVFIQVLGLLPHGARPGIDWRGMPLVSASACSLAGGLIAFRLRSVVCPLHSRMRWHLRVVAGIVFAVGAVGAQYYVLLAAGLPAQDAGAPPDWRLPLHGLSAFAAVGAAALLLLMHRQLQRQRPVEPAASKRGHGEDPAGFTDRLTGLPSRQMFEGMLAQAVHRADESGQCLALLVVNLDGFKPVNQTFGHLGGDLVLREVASRIRALGKPHMTARLAGDEFLILATQNPSARDASELAIRVIAEIARPCRVEQRDISISCSIGVAMYPEDGAMSALMTHAQAAMTAAKAAGGAGHAFFEPRMMRGQRDEVNLLRDLRLALDRGQMELFYQPKIHAPSGEITGAEALMRWHHPQRGVVSPTVFIPLAERYGLINALGRWLIDEACQQARAWRDDGLRMRVAINLSVHQLRQPDLSEQIADALKRHQINPDLLTCEITESSAMDDTDATIRVLGLLDKVGVHLAIDDFGTGHSSLAYLRKLPADELKIDRSFVLDLETSEEARKVALAVVNLAKALNLKVVAEGVETEGQNRILREFGCDQLQGYLFAKPMSAKALAAWAMDDIGPRTMNFRASLFDAAPSGMS